MGTLLQDIRYGARILMRFPGVTLAALLALALGTGVNTALFSIVNAVLLAPLPFPDSHELVQVWRTEMPPVRHRWQGATSSTMRIARAGPTSSWSASSSGEHDWVRTPVRSDRP